MTRRIKLGVLGGTFNPLHMGHLIIAQEAYLRLRLDKVIFVPAATPPHKPQEDLLDAMHRYRMVALTLRNDPRFVASDMEIKRSGKSYTVDTLEELRKKYGPRAEIYLIVGSDTLDEFPTWKDFPRIAQISQIVVVVRPGHSLERIDDLKAILGEDKVEEIKGLMLKDPLISISASDIRRRVARGESIRYLVPRTVERYIKKHRLYSYGKRQKGLML
ncbi:MAG: hypothetical protein AMS15_01920 [Planctomycetes bacterium DG_23]|nr:MAG: hypothetical protein AMS15_01920 [Planctomycetes bacterium DG_23]